MTHRCLILVPILSMLLGLAATPAFGQGANEIELLGNGGFEAGHAIAPWVTSSKNGNGMITGGQGGPNAPHAGNRLCKLGGSNDERDTLRQTVLVPAGSAGLTLGFWYRIKSAGNGTSAQDFLNVSLMDENGSLLASPAILSNMDAAEDWTYFQAALLAFSGYLIDLVVQAETDGTQPTAFLLDDVTLKYTIRPGTRGSPAIFIINPRTGCEKLPPPGPLPDVVLSGSTTVEAVGASADGIASMSLYLDGRLVARNEGEGRIEAVLPANSLTPGAHEITGEITDALGQTGLCRLPIAATKILEAGEMEGNPADFYWSKTSSRTLFLQDEAQSRSFEGFARLGSVPGANDLLSQYLPVAEDAQGTLTLSFYYRITTGKTTTAASDALLVQLRDRASGAVTTLRSFSNLSAVDGWALCQIPLAVGADVLPGSEYDLRFLATTTNAAHTTAFDLDDVAVWVRSQRLLDDPMGHLTPEPWESGALPCPPTLPPPDFYQIHANPPFCDGDDTFPGDPTVCFPRADKLINLCGLTEADLPGLQVTFRVTYGGVTRYASAPIWAWGSTGPNGLPWIEVAIPNSPFPDRFTPARVLVWNPGTPGMQSWSMAWKWKPEEHREQGFRYGYQDRPCPYWDLTTAVVSIPAWRMPGSTPNIFPVAANSLFIFRAPSGALLYPTAFVEDCAPIWPGAPAAPGYPPDPPCPGEGLRVPFSLKRWTVAQGPRVKFHWEIGNAGAPPACTPETPCVRTEHYFLPYYQNPGTEMLDETHQAILRGRGLEAGCCEVSPSSCIQFISFTLSEVVVPPELQPFGHGVTPPCSLETGLSSTVTLAPSLPGWFVRVMGVWLGDEPLTGLRGLPKFPKPLLAGQVGPSPCTCCVGVRIATTNPAGGWTSPGPMFGFVQGSSGPCPSCGN